jgi:methyl-accepting chemotaxis protein
MSNPAIPGGQAQYPSLAASNGAADDVTERLRDFLEIDDSSKQNARVLLALLAAHADDIFTSFYRKVQRSEISPHITDDAIERLKAKQKAHWVALFSSDFSRGYAQSVRRIGIRHREVALNPSWYVAGYAKLKIELMQRVAALDVPPEKKTDLMTTLEKYVAMDMALALSCYDVDILD